MDLSLGTAVFAALTQFFAYGVKGLAGFGSAPIAAPILSMRLDAAVVSPGILLLDCPANALIAWRQRGSFRPEQVLPLLGANLCGVLPGVWLLRFSLPWALKLALGAVVMGLGAEMLTRRLRPAGPDRPGRRLAVSFLSGLFSGMFGINMLIVAYLQRTAEDYGEFKGSICFLFLGENLVRMVLYLAGGFFTPAALLTAAAGAPGAALGLWLGGRLGGWLDEARLCRTAAALFLLSGGSVILQTALAQL